MNKNLSLAIEQAVEKINPRDNFPINNNKSDKKPDLFSLLIGISFGLYSETAFLIACDKILFIKTLVLLKNNYMLCANMLNILDKRINQQNIYRTFNKIIN